MNKKTRLWCIILFSFLGTSVAMAQKSEKDRHWVWELYGGANNYMTWEIETDVVYLKSATIIQYTIKGRFMNR